MSCVLCVVHMKLETLHMTQLSRALCFQIHLFSRGRTRTKYAWQIRGLAHRANGTRTEYIWQIGDLGTRTEYSIAFWGLHRVQMVLAPEFAKRTNPLYSPDQRARALRRQSTAKSLKLKTFEPLICYNSAAGAALRSSGIILHLLT